MFAELVRWEAVDALDDHLDRINAATQRDWTDLLQHFTEQCEPLTPSELRPIRPGRVPDGEWECSEEFSALADMLNRCWPTERSQRQ
jgi:hypothetical protein